MEAFFFRSADDLSLGVLEPFPGALLTIFFALFRPWVTCYQPGLFQNFTEFRLYGQEASGNPVADRPGLPLDSSSLYVYGYIELPQRSGELERLEDHHFGSFQTKIGIEIPIIDRDSSLSGSQPNASGGGFSSSRSIKSLFCHAFFLYRAKISGF
jgi:hypothetical protein